MPRKLSSLAPILLLLAAACAEPPTPSVDVGSGVRFVPAVADSFNDAGRHPAVVVNEDGLPVIAYFGFEEIPEEDELVQTRPIGSPTIPGVFLATVSEEGYWTRGAIAITEPIANVDVAFNPAFEPSVARLTPQNVTGLAMIADGQTYHAVWGSAGGIYHATGSLDPSTSTQATASLVSSTPGAGPSIALVDGEPWIAFYSSTSASASVLLATPDGDRWQVDAIADAGGCETCRTAVVDASGGPAVAYSAGGTGVWVATNDGENGWSSLGAAPSGGQGLSGTATGDDIALSFYDGSQVTVATGPPTGPFSTGSAGPITAIGDGSGSAPGAATSLQTTDDGSLVLAWLDTANGVALATGDTEILEPVDVSGATSDGAFPSVALTKDGSTAYLAWYATDEEDLVVGGYGDLGEVPFAAPSPTPTGTATVAPPPTTECTPVEGGVVTVVASGISFTDGSCIEAPAGEPFTIAFDNQDAGVPHNVQIFTGPEPTGDLLLETDTINGVAQTEYEVPALDAGEFAFNCVVHPTMVGQVQVDGGGGGATGPTGGTGTTGPDGGGAATVTAANIAFDTSTIELAADEPGSIAFVNEDSGVPHNIAIYPTADDLANALFSGEVITGPDEIEYAIDPLEAGEYYFQCDVHPTMNGSVIVA